MSPVASEEDEMEEKADESGYKTEEMMEDDLLEEIPSSPVSADSGLSENKKDSTGCSISIASWNRFWFNQTDGGKKHKVIRNLADTWSWM